ncbi:MAG: hypothetical protein KDE27_16475, partial [Planctomycetes bacterium]|nr:hypothetical protein [Planctomycetota bacterium]
WLRAGAATAVMAVAVRLARTAAPDAGHWQIALYNVAIPIGVGIAAYVATHVACGSPEWRSLRNRRR